MLVSRKSHKWKVKKAKTEPRESHLKLVQNGAYETIISNDWNNAIFT